MESSDLVKAQFILSQYFRELRLFVIMDVDAVTSVRHGHLPLCLQLYEYGCESECTSSHQSLTSKSFPYFPCQAAQGNGNDTGNRNIGLTGNQEPMPAMSASPGSLSRALSQEVQELEAQESKDHPQGVPYMAASRTTLSTQYKSCNKSAMTLTGNPLTFSCVTSAFCSVRRRLTHVRV